MTEYLTTKELANLLRIKERKVYDLAASGSVPCSRATGKLLFPREQIEAWLAESSTGLELVGKQPRPNVVVGSHDPLLEWALRESRSGLASYFDSSLDGMDRFQAGKGIATGLHLLDVKEEIWNVPLVRQRFHRDRVVLVRWATRQRGLIVNPGAEESIAGLSDLSGRSVVPRQPEAGSQILLAHLLRQAGIAADDIRWIAPARSESDATLSVLEGKAEATFGLAAIAQQHRLGFVPVIEERFDLLVDRRAWFEPPFQAFLEFCRSPGFAERSAEMPGYDLSGQFQVQFNGAT